MQGGLQHTIQQKSLNVTNLKTKSNSNNNNKQHNTSRTNYTIWEGARDASQSTASELITKSLPENVGYFHPLPKDHRWGPPQLLAQEIPQKNKLAKKNPKNPAAIQALPCTA